MLTVPPDTPETKPEASTVATDVLEDDQGVVASGVPDPVNCVVVFEQSVVVPVTVGVGLIVISKVSVEPIQVTPEFV